MMNIFATLREKDPTIKERIEELDRDLEYLIRINYKRSPIQPLIDEKNFLKQILRNIKLSKIK